MFPLNLTECSLTLAAGDPLWVAERGVGGGHGSHHAGHRHGSAQEEDEAGHERLAGHGRHDDHVDVLALI